MTGYAEVRTTSRRWRFTATATIMAMMGALLLVAGPASAQAVDDEFIWHTCVPITFDTGDGDVWQPEDGEVEITAEGVIADAFPLPASTTGIAADDETQPGDLFGLESIATIIFPEFFAEGLAIEVKMGLDTALPGFAPFFPEDTNVTDAQTQVPDPDGAVGPGLKEFQWVPGETDIGTWSTTAETEEYLVVAADPDDDTQGWHVEDGDGTIVFGPDSADAVAGFLAGHFDPVAEQLTSPSETEAYEITAESGETIDWTIDETPLAFDNGDLTITVDEDTKEVIDGAVTSLTIDVAAGIFAALVCQVTDNSPVVASAVEVATDVWHVAITDPGTTETLAIDESLVVALDPFGSQTGTLTADDGDVFLDGNLVEDPEELFFWPFEQEGYFSAEVMAPPHVFVTDVENQHVDTHARNEGDTLTFEGPSWPESGTVNDVELCDAPDGAGDCHSLDNLLNAQGDADSDPTVDSDGVLTGTGDVPAAVAGAPGDWYLRATVDTTESDDGMTELFSLLIILDDPVLTLTPNEGGIGSTVNLGGSGWNPLAAMEAQVIDPPDGEFGTATIDENGVLSGSITITSDDADQVDLEDPVMTIEARDIDPVTTAESDTAEFTLLTNEIELEPGEDGSLFQIVEFTLEGDTLVFSQVGAVIVMETLTIDGTDQVSTGAINQVEVNERRGTLEGWEIFGHLQTDLLQSGQDPADPDEHRFIPAEDLTWDPVCTPITSDPGEIFTGASNNLAAPTLLCQGDPGGGITQGDADLQLQVPSTQAAGFYSAILELELQSGGSL